VTYPGGKNTKKGSHCNGWPTQVKIERKMRAQRCTQKDGWGLEGALEGGEGSKAHSKGWSRAQRRTRRRWGLEGALKRMVEGSKAHSKEVRARRCTKRMVEGSKARSKEVRAWRRTQKDGRRRTRKETRAQRHARKGSEGSKARSKGSEDLKARLKGGRVRKRTTLDGWEKVVEK
jgi:hypothetical protein